jgi:prepilin-type N-terminal cleavage/methylation domain-containing protein
MRLLKLHQRGDTIVEVLIAMAIVSSVLGISYSTVSRSKKTIQNAQERSQALRLVEGQVEQLRSFATDTAKVVTLNVQNNIFCFNKTSAVDATPKIYNAYAGAVTTVPSNPDADTAPYQSDCIDSSTGVAYSLSIDPPPSGGNTYIFRARWDRIGGGAKQEVYIAFRAVGVRP